MSIMDNDIDLFARKDCNVLTYIYCIFAQVPPNLSIDQSARVDVDQHTKEKALLMSQQMLQQVSGVVTPLGVATAYHLYNQARNKSLITLNNKLGQGYKLRQSNANR